MKTFSKKYSTVSRKKMIAMKNNLLLILVLLSIAKISNSQELLTLENAKNIALAQSYQMKLSENNIDIASTKTRLQAVGRKPTLGLNSSINGHLNNSRQKYFQSPESSTNWLAPSIDAGVSASSSYLLWDDSSIENRIDQAIEEEKLAQLALNSTKEDIVYQVENAYLNVARMKENRSLLEESIAISKKRKKRAEYGFEYGSSDKLALLNAEVDLNRDSVNILKFIQQLVNAKRNLNLVLNRDINTKFEVEDNHEIDYTLSFEQFFDAALDNNMQLKEAKQNLKISSYDKKINDSNLKPQVRANASYGINYRNNSDISPLDYSLGDGLNLGLSANWPLFDGGRTKQLNELAELKMNSQSLLIQQIEDRIQLQITNAWGEYQNALLVYHLEEKNLATAKENFNRTEEKFKSGQINSITFRQAQLNYLVAKLNLSTAKYNTILVALDLKQLSGELL